MPDSKTTRFTVVRPVRYARKLRQPGDALELTPQQAAFLRAGGFIRADDAAPEAQAEAQATRGFIRPAEAAPEAQTEAQATRKKKEGA